MSISPTLASRLFLDARLSATARLGAAPQPARGRREVFPEVVVDVRDLPSRRTPVVAPLRRVSAAR